MRQLFDLFSFRGRASREKFWLSFFAFYLVIMATAPFPASFLIAKLSVTLAPLYVFIAMCARRLHDKNQTAFWLLPYSGWLMAAYLVGFWFVLGLIGTGPGTAGHNRFGEPP
jgi:uncharacterized membrane protein YhaH (DUF805 family)